MGLFFFRKRSTEDGEKTTVWDKEERLFDDPVYRCRECGGTFDRPYDRCPECGAKVVRIVTDPQWVDEIEFLEL